MPPSQAEPSRPAAARAQDLRRLPSAAAAAAAAAAALPPAGAVSGKAGTHTPPRFAASSLPRCRRRTPPAGSAPPPRLRLEAPGQPRRPRRGGSRSPQPPRGAWRSSPGRAEGRPAALASSPRRRPGPRPFCSSLLPLGFWPVSRSVVKSIPWVGAAPSKAPRRLLGQRNARRVRGESGLMGPNTTRNTCCHLHCPGAADTSIKKKKKKTPRRLTMFRRVWWYKVAVSFQEVVHRRNP